MHGESLPARVLAWLRAGYPRGLLITDAAPVTYVLRRHLNDADIEEIFSQIIFAKGENRPLKKGVITREDIHWFIRSTVGQEPSDADIDRVTQRLKQGGFPLEQHEDDASSDNPS